MKDTSLGLYLHIPFCLQKCRYCDFCSFPAQGKETKHAYVQALCRELEASAIKAADHTVDTVFFGGGTPTCLSTADLVALCDHIRRHYRLARDVEWTSEANPATVDEGKLRAMREAGINRISLGMQSANENELALLGRVHRPPDMYAAAEALQKAGFQNWSLDLMFGIPAQTAESFARSLDEAIALAPTHISAYSLQIEEGTPFYRERDTLPLPDEDAEAAMATLLYQKMAEAGYHRYEISNFARPGFESRHNLRYWRMRNYLGFGIAAHSCFAHERFYNREGLADYIKDPLGMREREETLTATAREYETVMLGLRLSAGIDDDAFETAFGYGFFEKYGARLAPFLAAGLARREGKKTCLTADGMALSNAILAKILED